MIKKIIAYCKNLIALVIGRFNQKWLIDFINKGFFNNYYLNGKMKKQVSFLRNSDDCDLPISIKYYFPNGILKAEELVDKVIAPNTSKDTYYYENGKVKNILFLKKGKVEGVSKQFYQNGKLQFEMHNKNGKMDGVARTYFENGVLSMEGFRKNNKIEGVSKSYYESGKLEVVASMKNDNLDGPYELYWENGNLMKKCEYKRGKPHGIYEEYDFSGNLIGKKRFCNGREQKME